MSLEKLGEQRLHEEMRAGRSVIPLFRDLLNDYGTARIEILVGAISAGLGLIGSLQARGVKLTMNSANGGQHKAAAPKRAPSFPRMNL